MTKGLMYGEAEYFCAGSSLIQKLFHTDRW